MNIEEISPRIYDERQLKALTGLSVGQFSILLPVFDKFILEDKENKVKPENGSIGKLKSSAEKLIFFLYYLKCYPTFDQFGFNFNMNRSCAHTWLYKIFPIFTQTLDHLNVLPKNKFNTPEEMQQSFKGIDTLVIDATERAIQRPQDPAVQVEHYSGKKKDTPTKIRLSLPWILLFCM